MTRKIKTSKKKKKSHGTERGELLEESSFYLMDELDVYRVLKI
jgi:hypothetical protein